jgi:hypothetical protein
MDRKKLLFLNYVMAAANFLANLVGDDMTLVIIEIETLPCNGC